MNNPSNHSFEGLVCPLPLKQKDAIVIGHGSGGRMTHELIQEIFQKSFGNPILNSSNDFAAVALPEKAKMKGSICLSTDAHIINPIIFPGGDIGRLAISGTVNDISMSGGIPLYITSSFIIEEGLPIGTLKTIVDSMKTTALEAGVQIVAGDTKVVEKGKADKLFISTTGMGWIPEGRQIGGEMAQDGDVIIVSGTIGDHGIAVLAARGELKFSTTIQSDVAPLNHLIHSVLEAAPHVHVLRDPTRGGLATSLNEIAFQSQVSILLEEDAIPIDPEVQAACEMLGFDPLFVANEGKVIVILPANEADAALYKLQNHSLGKKAAIIGMVRKDPKYRVLLKTTIGGTRIVDMLAGEMLPRIC
jgi:hydrogenase expression/formation protein HypE